MQRFAHFWAPTFVRFKFSVASSSSQKHVSAASLTHPMLAKARGRSESGSDTTARKGRCIPVSPVSETYCKEFADQSAKCQEPCSR